MEIFVLSLTVLVCRIVDVSLATVRTFYNVKGKKFTAAGVGFAEALIWFLVVKQALDVKATGWEGLVIALAFSLGFAAGTIVGGTLIKKFDRGKIQVQIIINETKKEILKFLRDAGFAVTVVDVKKSEFSEEKMMLFLEVNNTQFQKVKKIVEDIDDKAFIMVHESKAVFNGFFTRM